VVRVDFEQASDSCVCFLDQPYLGSGDSSIYANTEDARVSFSILSWGIRPHGEESIAAALAMHIIDNAGGRACNPRHDMHAKTPTFDKHICANSARLPMPIRNERRVSRGPPPRTYGRRPKGEGRPSPSGPSLWLWSGRHESHPSRRLLAFCT
jgi:hypothetical protein